MACKFSVLKQLATHRSFTLQTRAQAQHTLQNTFRAHCQAHSLLGVPRLQAQSISACCLPPATLRRQHTQHTADCSLLCCQHSILRDSTSSSATLASFAKLQQYRQYGKQGYQRQWHRLMGTGGARKVIELQEADEKEQHKQQQKEESSEDSVKRQTDFDKSLKKRETKLIAHQSVIAHMSDVRTPRSLLNKSQKQIWDVSSCVLLCMPGLLRFSISEKVSASCISMLISIYILCYGPFQPEPALCKTV